MFTFPLWGFILLWATGILTGGLMVYLWGPRRTVEVDRTEENRPLNVFDAYSDKELERLRKEVAQRVQSHMRYNSSSSITEEKVRELRKIDDEIQARANAKLALEESKVTQIEREIAMFDAAYGHLLSNAEKKEIK